MRPETSASVADNPLNLIRVMPAKGRISEKFFPQPHDPYSTECKHAISFGFLYQLRHAAAGAAAQPREIETVEVVVTTGFRTEALTDRPGSISVIGESRLVGVRIRHEF